MQSADENESPNLQNAAFAGHKMKGENRFEIITQEMLPSIAGMSSTTFLGLRLMLGTMLLQRNCTSGLLLPNKVFCRLYSETEGHILYEIYHTAPAAIAMAPRFVPTFFTATARVYHHSLVCPLMMFSGGLMWG